MKTDARSPQRGQIIVLLALALVGMVAMTGLVIDGGSAYAQRRGQQNAADLAALAGADALINGADTTQAATDIATANGYTTGGDTTVTVTTNTAAGTVKVDIKAPHRNHFAGVVGMPTWDVTVTATAIGGVPTQVRGAAPIIFSDDVFNEKNELIDLYATATDFTKTQGSGSDAPLAVDNMAWTNLGTGSVSSDDVKDALDGTAPINANLVLNQYIGQANNGVKNTLFDTNSPQQPSVNTTLAGLDVVVPIVGGPITGEAVCSPDNSGGGNHINGCFQGWALFHVVSATKNGSGEDGTVTGYFKSGITRSASSTGVCTSGSSCPGFRGLYVVKLIN